MTVLGTNEKPTRPPPRKLKLTTKPRPTASQIKPTATAANVATTSTAVKPKWKSPVERARKEHNLKPLVKNKVLNKQETNKQIKKTALKQRSKIQSKKITAVNPVGGKDEVKPKTNQTATADLKTNTLKSRSNLKDTTLHVKKKSLPRKGTQKHMGLEKNSIKMEQPAEEHVSFMNITKTNMKANRTRQHKVQVRNKQAAGVKAL